MHKHQIDQLMRDMWAAKNRGDLETANALWLEIVDIIAARKPEQIKRLEAERGIG